MTTDSIKELVKRLAAGRTLLLRADGDRDLGFQSNITTDTSMTLADELKSAIDALEAMAGEIARLNAECCRCGQPTTALCKAARDAEARAERLRVALEEIKDGDCQPGPPGQVWKVSGRWARIARKALIEDDKQ